ISGALARLQKEFEEQIPRHLEAIIGAGAHVAERLEIVFQRAHRGARGGFVPDLAKQRHLGVVGALRDRGHSAVTNLTFATRPPSMRSANAPHTAEISWSKRF